MSEISNRVEELQRLFESYDVFTVKVKEGYLEQVPYLVDTVAAARELVSFLADRLEDREVAELDLQYMREHGRPTCDFIFTDLDEDDGVWRYCTHFYAHMGNHRGRPLTNVELSNLIADLQDASE